MIIKLIEKVQLTVGVIALSVFLIAILIQVFARYFGIPVIWTEEVANYSFIWAVFMGASVMLNRRQHFKFDLFSQKLKGKSRTYLNIFNDSILLIFNLAIFYYGIITVKNFWNYNWVSLPMIKMGYVWISIPIMGLTMSIYTLGHMMCSIKELKGKEVK
ncbi:MAG: TRAP-type transport system small permease protein [Clostridiales bacterium]|jgi:TRAP-type C4-dicarboxylate transport system permease small subunit|nr:TRAP-type transport system small permease protein [Clostridiales bacterium]MDK2933212.1 TRAP-type transport system small permease protein [Clostridiales bacterium]